MSNFNLISPIGNGYNYNVRFDEPIVIPENASCHLNWAMFERDNKVRFSQQQKITIIPSKVLPYWDYHNNGNGQEDGKYVVNASKNDTDLVFTIDAGTYNLQELQTVISEQLGNSTMGKSIVPQATLNRGTMTDSADASNNPSLSLYDYTLVVPSNDIDPSYLEFGYMINMGQSDFVKHGTHKLDCDDSDGNGNFKQTAGSSGTFDGSGNTTATSWKMYALADKEYIHTGGHFNQYIKENNGGTGRVMKDTGFDEFQNLNTINFTSNKNIDDQQGNIFIGLYSEAYAGASDASHLGEDDDADRLQGTILKVVNDGATGAYYPKCYFGVEICGNNTQEANKKHINILSSGIGVSTNTLNSNLTTMTRIAQINMTNFRSGTDNSPVSIGIQTYFDKGNVNYINHQAHKGALHIRVYAHSADGSSVVIFDTDTKYPHNTNIHIPFSSEWLESNSIGANPATMTLAMAKSSIPFSPVVATTQDGEGGRLTFTARSKEVATASTYNNTTNTLLLDYSVKLTTELGKLFYPTSSSLTLAQKSAAYINYAGAINYMNDQYNGGYTTTTLGQNEYFFRNNKVVGQFRTDKFSIILNNLPIKSYKNIDDKTKSGYRKPILANVPSPFGSADDNVGLNGVIVGNYAASLGVVNRLSNQAITTNNFDVEIRNLENDKPAEQLVKSIINFTINAD